ncbi:O-antigen ligase [Rhizobium sp. WYJ-E13]|uniref:O-antigen ligase family protein n=1 Tax=Rhizobium sp. WYJ-E13 TaxID=2849093 RepID=UPI001C1EE11E|nr:O-antigen ligase family protein [Rhizobium sp. WYJ-E13]QWW71909.1 O-antigen ligase family protein [Rhizobium sp. WYJ-E13]
MAHDLPHFLFQMTSLRISPDLLLYIYCGLIVLSVVPFGLVDILPQTLILILMCILGGVAVVLYGPPERGQWVFGTALAIFSLMALWILFQTVEIPFTRSDDLVWAKARTMAAAAKTISVEPADTLAALLQIALPAVTFLTGLIVADRSKDDQAMLRFLASAAGILAMYGLYQFLFLPDTLLGETKKAYQESLTATFVNRNTNATFFGLGLLMQLTLLFDSFLFKTDKASAELQSNATLPRLYYCFISLATFAALMLTQSRAGVFLTAFAILVYTPFLASQWLRIFPNSFVRLGSRWLRVAVVIAAACLGTGFFLLFASKAMLRANIQGLEDARFCIWPDVVRATYNNWLFGTGFGTFRTVFSGYRDSRCGIFNIFDRAHNTYLEGFLTLGVIFPVVALLVLAALLFIFWRGYRNRRRNRHYAVLGLAATILVWGHALVDFSIQIPGFSVFYAAFLSGVVCVCYKHTLKPAASKNAALHKYNNDEIELELIY